MPEIVAYTFRADTFCPSCIITQLPTGDGEAFDGWALAPGVQMDTQANLAEIAHAFGIDWMRERSYDSRDFPKVVFSDQVEDDTELCGACHRPLIP